MVGAQLVELDAEMAKLNFVADYKTGMRGEMGAQGGIFDYLRRHPDQFSSVLGNGNPADKSLGARILWHLVPSGWFYRNRLSCARPVVEWYLPVADTNHGTLSPKAVRQADAQVKADLKHRNRYNVAEGLFLNALGNSVRRFAYGQESADLARVAIALERFHLAHGEYPGTLDALEPRFIETVPPDVINGEPLHYRRPLDGKFLIYSVGWNETDDNGRMTTVRNGGIDNAQGDWIWQN